MLNWPEETISSSDRAKWHHAGSNLCLDFHGDPLTAKLVVFSDGNHHMALMESLELFQKMHPELARHIFYVTTPPQPVVQLLRHGSLQIGNFILSIRPHVFISPSAVLDNLVKEGYMQEHFPFMRNQGSVFLVQKGNPKKIAGIGDLLREDISLFLSNPKTETVSYKGYVNTLLALAAREKLDLSFLSEKGSTTTKVCHGEQIHHREAPQALVDGRADVAVVFYHLALRYTRIFPSLFEMIPLGGTVAAPQPFPGNVVSKSHVGVIDDGGHWGTRFATFLSSDSVSKIYFHHGLLPAT